MSKFIIRKYSDQMRIAKYEILLQQKLNETGAIQWKWVLSTSITLYPKDGTKGRIKTDKKWAPNRI